MSHAPPKWDLSDLFSGIDDPKIDRALEDVHERSKAFAEKYRGRLTEPDLSAYMLFDMISEYEQLAVALTKPANYAHLVYSTDTASSEVGAFLQRIEERTTEIGLETMFFGLELLEIEEGKMDELLAEPVLTKYKHYIQSTRVFKDFMLSEPEERIMEEMRASGGRAFGRLHSEVLANHVFKMEIAGEVRELTEPEILDYLRDADRGVRKAAAEGLTKGLTELERVLVLTFNTLLLEKATNDRLRGYEGPEQSRHLNNELAPETVEMVMCVCEEHHELCARYYKLKKDILGLPELTHYDRYAPLFDAQSEVSWEEGKSIVLESFGKFSSTIHDKAARFFDRGWIDAEARPGKIGGAYCSYVTPDIHPYVFMNYMDKMDSVLTLAHELGHGVHSSLSQEQSYFNYHGTLPLAELASTFGEMLVFDALQERASLRDRLAMYADNIEGSFATIFRQAAMYRFEQDAHKHRREKGELSPDALGGYWQARQQAMFGDSVALGDEHRKWWSYVPHFVHSAFYVYAYSFGELLVMSLYEMARQQGPGFERKYVDLLRAGGSKTPHELMAGVGIDLTDRNFWVGGFKVLERRIEEFEKLWETYKQSN